jgi:O-glycosyl hydrolase
MGPETLGMDQTFTSTVNNNAGPNLKYICGHIYGHPPYYYNWGKESWMTEHITDTNDANIWGGALNTAREIHNCMYTGYSMWVFWYIKRNYGLLDESGNITKRGYAVAQFARYIRPGSNKISCTSNPTSGVYVTAYKKGSQLIVVAINMNSSTTYQPFNINGMSVSGFNRYRTTRTSNLSNDSFTVSGNSFGINLPAASVTTLVSY